MALINCDFYSDTLGLSTSMSVILPQQPKTQIGLNSVADYANPRVLYLLHGLSDDNTAWIRNTSIERYVAKYGLAVVMPNVHRSWYTNIDDGGKYWDFISEELPGIVQSFFNVSDKPEDTFVAGLSMGGYGAFKLAFNNPEKFAGAASLSGSLDMVNRAGRLDDVMKLNEHKRIFGEEVALENNLFKLVENRIKENQKLPKLYQCCGTEDFLYDVNLNMKKHLEDLNVDFVYEEEKGNHNWLYWDMKIQSVLRWINKIKS